MRRLHRPLRHLRPPAVVVLALLLLGLLPSFALGEQLQWQWRNPLPQSNHLYEVAYGNGQFMAVGDWTLVSSPDGARWSLQAGSPPGVTGVAYGAGQWVVASASRRTLFSSPTGSDWKSRHFSEKLVLSVDYAGDLFLAMGERGALLTSPDGLTWTERPSRTSATLRSAAYGAGRWVVVGDAGTVLTSADGVTWKLQDAGAAGRLYAVAYGGGRFVAVGVEGTVITSADGSAWSAVPVKAEMNLTSVAWGQDRFVAVTYEGEVLVSADGAAWEAMKPEAAAELQDVTWDGGQFVAVGFYGAILTSADGMGWTLRTAGLGEVLYKVAHGAGRFVAVGARGRVLTSRDGAAWAPAPRPTAETLVGVTYAAGQFVAVGTGGVILTSPDGTAWTLRTSGTDVTLYAVAHGAGRFVAAGDGGTILTSADGITWAAAASGTDRDLFGVTYAAGQFVAPGAFGTLLTSADGQTWTPRLSRTEQALVTAAYGGGRWVVVGEYDTVVVSSDGAIFTPAPSDGTDEVLWGVTWAEGQFLMVTADGQIYSSADGQRWEWQETDNLQPLHGIVYADGLAVAVGDASTILVGTRPLADRSRSSVSASAESAPADGQTAVRIAVALRDPQGRALAGREVTLDQGPGQARIQPAAATTDSEGRALFLVTGTADETVTFRARIPADDITLLQTVTVRFTICGRLFPDVPGSHPACAAIEDLAGRKVVGGYPDGSFQPDRTVTRAEFAKMLVLALGRPPQPGTGTPFTDLAGHWVAEQGYLQAAVEAGAISGFPDGTFRPNDPVTRGQVVKIAAAAAQLTPIVSGLYTDVRQEDWFAGWVGIAAWRGLIGSKAPFPVWTGAEFRGGDPANRGEAARVLANLIALRRQG